jgi:hypothetical protein
VNREIRKNRARWRNFNFTLTDLWVMVKQGFEEPILSHRIWCREGKATHGLRGFEATQKQIMLIVWVTG